MGIINNSIMLGNPKGKFETLVTKLLAGKLY